MKLRAAFVVPAIVIIVALGVIAAVFPDVLRLATALMPVVLAVATVGMIVAERRRRRRRQNPSSRN